MTRAVGNFRWASPESMKDVVYSEIVYSFGLIMIELDTLELPYTSYGAKGDMILMDASSNLALRCAEIDPEKRLSAIELCRYFNNNFAAVKILIANFTFRDQVAQTKYHNNGGCNPMWSVVVTFKDVNQMDDSLEICIKNKNWVKSGEIGKSTMEFNETIDELDDNQSVNWMWMEVFTDGEKNGHILVKIQYKGHLLQWMTQCKTSRDNFHANRGSVHMMMKHK
ncbi:hypothetical protein THRCLA_21298 [Thraustotheca clavata]|uniref:C2 domain-containing protein n=1 Tax=Thraustotheca clavata TaxID=74557 RepID=A0A1V9ZYK7_9STRA|nr:hypothetical protein THRCLA_21298 [Thraustotheca clavata]